MNHGDIIELNSDGEEIKVQHQPQTAPVAPAAGQSSGEVKQEDPAVIAAKQKTAEFNAEFEKALSGKPYNKTILTAEAVNLKANALSLRLLDKAVLVMGQVNKNTDKILEIIDEQY